MLGLLRALHAEVPDEGVGTTSVAAALHVVAASRTTGGLVTIISDFRGPLDWRRPLTEVAGRHTVLAIEIVDPREESLVDVGELTLIDPETGRKTVLAKDFPIGLPVPAGLPPMFIPTGVAVSTTGAIYVSSDVDSAIYRLKPAP